MLRQQNIFQAGTALQLTTVRSVRSRSTRQAACSRAWRTVRWRQKRHLLTKKGPGATVAKTGHVAPGPNARFGCALMMHGRVRTCRPTRSRNAATRRSSRACTADAASSIAALARHALTWSMYAQNSARSVSSSARSSASGAQPALQAEVGRRVQNKSSINYPQSGMCPPVPAPAARSLYCKKGW